MQISIDETRNYNLYTRPGNNKKVNAREKSF